MAAKDKWGRLDRMKYRDGNRRVGKRRDRTWRSEAGNGALEITAISIDGGNRWVDASGGDVVGVGQRT